MSIVSFAAGFVAGWFVRSTVESSRELAVEAGATFEHLVQKLRRAIAAEREFFEDLWAEARARGEEEEEEGAAHEPPRPDGEVANGEVVR